MTASIEQNMDFVGETTGENTAMVVPESAHRPMVPRHVNTRAEPEGTLGGVAQRCQESIEAAPSKLQSSNGGAANAV